MTNHASPHLRPRLVVADAAKAIDYYRTVFGAEEITRFDGPDGGIVHAELALGEARWTLKDADGTDRAPEPDRANPVLLMLQVPDVDAVAARMLDAGGTAVIPIADSEYGRGGRIKDPFGHVWMISQPPTG